jgi:predicted nucleic acid-binding protein
MRLLISDANILIDMEVGVPISHFDMPACFTESCPVHNCWSPLDDPAAGSMRFLAPAREVPRGLETRVVVTYAGMYGVRHEYETDTSNGGGPRPEGQDRGPAARKIRFPHGRRIFRFAWSAATDLSRLTSHHLIAHWNTRGTDPVRRRLQATSARKVPVRILVDTNVVLDLLLGREPFVQDAAAIFAMVERSEVEGLLCATTLTTLDYLLSQSLSKDESRSTIRRLLSLFEIAAVNRVVLEVASESPMHDFEDAVLAESANHAGADRIVTRNTSDFLESPVVAVDPSEFLVQFSSAESAGDDVGR